jgi:hypothetical protein
VAIHNPPNEYVITDVPGKIPVTIPVPDPMVAMPMLPLLQIPDGTLLLKAVVCP